MPAFDPNIHAIDPKSGFQVEKATGRPVGLISPDHQPVAPIGEFPKWVPVHESRIQRRKADGAPDHVSVDGFVHVFVNRADGAVTVMVRDEDEERAAGSPLAASDAAPVQEPEELSSVNEP